MDSVLDVQLEHDVHHKQLVQGLNAQGFRVVAVAYKLMLGDDDEPHYEIQDEADITLLGYLAILDPPKETVTEALKRLHALNVDVKILTGDNEIITTYIHHRHGGRMADDIAAGQHARICPASTAVLAAVGDHAALLRDPHSSRQDLVLPQVWRMRTVARKYLNRHRE